MPEEARLRLYPDGTVRGLYTEAVPLHELGTLTVSRASSVEFSRRKQKWEVRPDKSWGDPRQVLFSDKSREACLRWETRNILDAMQRSGK